MFYFSFSKFYIQLRKRFRTIYVSICSTMLWASKLFTSEKYRDHINPYLQTVNTMFRLVIVNVHIPRDLKIVQYPKRQKNCISLRGMSFYVSGQQNIPHVNVRSTSVVMSVLTNFFDKKCQTNFEKCGKISIFEFQSMFLCI